MTTAAAETVDLLPAFNLRLTQPRHGYRYSLDPFLLAEFCQPATGRIMDLGTGCGIIPLLLARRQATASLVGVELQPQLADLARRNALENGLADRIQIVPADLHDLASRFPANSFDLVVANPPYRRAGTGKVSPTAGRDLARHESSATLADFLAVAKKLVVSGGRLCFIYHPERLAEFLTEAARLKLAVRRLCLVHGDQSAPAKMVLIELLKGRQSALKVLSPLFVYGEEGEYTPEVGRLCGQPVVEGG
jgi:tRNA1Val (adenine37-N6)-methyltransferase